MLSAVLSLHDVMPETFRRMEEILDYTRKAGIPPFTLLVVPGRDWQAGQLDHLRRLAGEGYSLAAHGWVHRTRPTRLYHRLHAAILSRNVAEHLALDEEGIAALMQRSLGWFADQNLPEPELYVPPAWAIGRISRTRLQALPVRYVEVLRGVIEVRTGRLDRLPVIGFEADTRWRSVAVRGWNRIALESARLRSSAVRISLHPEDFHLRLKTSLRHILRSEFRWQSYPAALADAAV